MKQFLFLILLFACTAAYAQKYVLIDKKMVQPVSYTNVVTVEQSYNDMFAVEKSNIHQFISQLEKVAAILTDKKKPKPEMMDFVIGKTRFFGLKVPLASEEKFDVVLTTNCEGNKFTMHLSDAKLSNANNAFYINTWIKYIKGYLK